MENSHSSRDIIYKTTLILLAVAINSIEFIIPRIPFFPWLKPGLANCVTIIWIVEFGVVDALLFSLLRIWIVGFYFGFSFYTISLSLSGGICSTLVMGLVWTALGKRGWLGSVGMGVIGALVHNLTQIVVIYFLLAKNVHLFYQVPLMIAASIVFGFITGICAPSLLYFLHDAQRKLSYGKPAVVLTSGSVRKRDSIAPLLLLCAGCGVALIDNVTILGLCAGISALAVQMINRGSLKLLLSPITRFWPMFLFIAFVHGFFSYGTKIENLPLITYEGLRLTCVQWLKLLTWLEFSFILTYFNFHRILFRALQKLFPKNQAALFSGVLALEYFPALVGVIQKKTKSRFLWGLKHPFQGARKSLLFICNEIERLLYA